MAHVKKRVGRLCMLLLWVMGTPWAVATDFSMRCDYSTALYTSPEQAAQGYRKDQFKPVESELTPIGWANHPIWIVCQTADLWPKDNNLALIAVPMPVAKFEAWIQEPDKGDWHSLGQSGLLTAPSAGGSNRSGLATIWLPRLQGKPLMVLRSQPLGLSFAQIQIQDFPDWLGNRYRAGCLAGMLVLLLILYAAVNIFIPISGKERASLITSTLMVIDACFLAGVNGLFPIGISGGDPVLWNWMGYLILALLMAANTWWVLSVLSLRATWLKQSLWAYGLALLIGTGMSDSPLPALMVTQLVHSVLILIHGVFTRPLPGTVLIRIERAAIVALILAIGAQQLALLSIIPTSRAIQLGWQMLSVGIILLTLARLIATSFSDRRRVQMERARLNQMLLAEKRMLEDRVTQRSTELHEALGEIKRFEKHQRELLSLASHEFRTPAAIIKTSLEVVRYMPGSISEQAQPFMDSARQAAEQLIFLTNKLIEHDRWREMSVKPKMQPVELHAWMSAELPKDHRVRTDICKPPVEVLADVVLLRIAVHNLIDNALAHSGSLGTVTVTLSTTDTHAHLIVDDQGKGVPDAMKPRVFERFVSSRGGRSHGLGLSIVKSLAHLHGGDVTVADAPVKGARFIISLPLMRTSDT